MEFIVNAHENSSGEICAEAERQRESVCVCCEYCMQLLLECHHHRCRRLHLITNHYSLKYHGDILLYGGECVQSVKSFQWLQWINKWLLKRNNTYSKMGLYWTHERKWFHERVNVLLNHKKSSSNTSWHVKWMNDDDDNSLELSGRLH